MNQDALLHLLMTADSGQIDVTSPQRGDADYRQRARLIDRDAGLCVLLTRCCAPPANELGLPRRWYALSVTRFDPDGGRTLPTTLDDVDGVGRALFGAAIDGAIATLDTFVPNQVQVNLSCGDGWAVEAWRSDLPAASSWFRWSRRADVAWMIEDVAA